jgi:TatA/E family protein of Tat protein translocase
MFGTLGAPELLIIGVIIVLLFGVGKLSGLGRDLGSSVKEFRKAIKDEDEPKPQVQAQVQPPQQQYAPPPVQQYAPPPQQYAPPQAPPPPPQFAPPPPAQGDQPQKNIF